MQLRVRTWIDTIGSTIKTIPKEIIIPLSFILPFSILYVMEPETFEIVWKGRVPYLIFLWLLILELTLAWKKLPKNTLGTKWFRTILTIITLAAPTVYVFSTYSFGLNHGIIELGKLAGLTQHLQSIGIRQPELGVIVNSVWPVSFEYILFFLFFAASILLMYTFEGLKRFPISMFFLGATASFFMIDTFYPFATLAILQSFVPIIVSVVAFLLGLMGYKADWLGVDGYFPVLLVTREDSLPFAASVYWPCAGVTSLFIYTFVILFFIKDAAMSLKRKAVYVALGAVGTFFANALRIVSICIIGVNVGQKAAELFHSFYGELYFVAWIILYFVFIIYGRTILTKLSIFGAKLTKIAQELLSKIYHWRI